MIDYVAAESTWALKGTRLCSTAILIKHYSRAVGKLMMRMGMITNIQRRYQFLEFSVCVEIAPHRNGLDPKKDKRCVGVTQRSMSGTPWEQEQSERADVSFGNG